MLDHLHRHVVEVLAPVTIATLSTCGPAGIQAEVLPCEACGLILYLLVPPGSDHLYNLEQNPTVVVTADDWQVRGYAHPIESREAPHGLELANLPQSAGRTLIAVRPRRLQIGRPNGWGFSETIDFSSEESAAAAGMADD